MCECRVETKNGNDADNSIKGLVKNDASKNGQKKFWHS